MLEVTQADREAAAAYWKASRIGNSETQRRYLSGEADDSLIVQALARHRLAERDAVVKWLRQTWRTDMYDIECLDIADDIEAGEHLK